LVGGDLLVRENLRNIWSSSAISFFGWVKRLFLNFGVYEAQIVTCEIQLRRVVGRLGHFSLPKELVRLFFVALRGVLSSRCLKCVIAQLRIYL
jgi:hypothetical protein